MNIRESITITLLATRKWTSDASAPMSPDDAIATIQDLASERGFSLVAGEALDLAVNALALANDGTEVLDDTEAAHA